MAELFEYFWSAAWTPPELGPGEVEMTDRRIEVLRRLVAELTAGLGAESRFQAGVHAARLGWI